jgi:Holliday junction resolvasome RuvABC endonuclease subunit
MAWIAFIDAGERLFALNVVPISGKTGPTFSRLVEHLKMMGLEKQEYLQTLYLERPWGRNNVATTLALGRVAVLVETAASYVGIEVHYVQPSTWRKGVFGKGQKRTRAEWKKKALEFAAQLWPERAFETDNEAEAALIALYGSRQNEVV